VRAPFRMWLNEIVVLSLIAAVPTIARAADHVIHISVDGLNATMLQSVIDAGNAPNFKRFEDEGTWTINARTDYSYTVTLPNHTSMITGRPVTQPEGMPNTVHHGYTSNDFPEENETLHNSGNPNVSYIPSVFDVAHDAGLSTALFSGKTKFAIFDQSYNEENGAPNENGKDKIDRFFAYEDGQPAYTATTQNQFVLDMAASHYDYAFVHYSDTDYTGHSLSWGSPAYLAAVTQVDSYLASVFSLVENDETLAGCTTIILSADHGGSGYDHSDPTLAVDYTIPFFVWGAGVTHGDLYALNAATRTNPGNSRPSYTQVGQPIRNGDTGNLALALLGLGPIPGSLINAAQDLRVSLAGDFNFDGTVDAADYTVWRDTLGSTTNLSADGDGDHLVGVGDYAVWKTNFGQHVGSGSTEASPFQDAVPEPASWLLFCVGAAALGSFRCRS